MELNFREFFEPQTDELTLKLQVINDYVYSDMKVRDIIKKADISIGDFYRILREYGYAPQRQHFADDLVLTYASMGYSPTEIAEFPNVKMTLRNIRNILNKNKQESNDSEWK